jgi:hypothetical protein
MPPARRPCLLLAFPPVDAFQGFVGSKANLPFRESDLRIKNLVEVRDIDLRSRNIEGGAPQRSAIINLLRGNIIRNISAILPEEIHFLVYA